MCTRNVSKSSVRYDFTWLYHIGCITSLLPLPCNRHPQLRRSGNVGPRHNLEDKTHQFLSSVVFHWQFLQGPGAGQNLFEIHPTPYVTLEKKTSIKWGHVTGIGTRLSNVDGVVACHLERPGGVGHRLKVTVGSMSRCLSWMGWMGCHGTAVDTCLEGGVPISGSCRAGGH